MTVCFSCFSEASRLIASLLRTRYVEDAVINDMAGFPFPPGGRALMSKNPANEEEAASTGLGFLAATCHIQKLFLLCIFFP